MNFYNRVKFTTATSGTDTLTVGSASTGFRTPAQAGIPDGTIVRYVIEDPPASANWETGYGTYTVAGTTLSRNVMQSSNADALLNVSGSGTVVRITALAEDVSGGRSLISSQSPTGTGTVTFSSIASHYTKLIIEYAARGTQVATEVSMDIVINSDTTDANYQRVLTTSYATTTVQTASAANNIIDDAVIANSGPASEASYGVVEIPFYASTTFFKKIFFRASKRRDASTNKEQHNIGGMDWESSSAISQIDFILSAGNYDTGSIFKLYGVM